MPEFTQGQLVACWDREDCDKAIRIYVGREGMVYRCRLPGFEHGDPDFGLWEYCVPLEELAPEAFLARERRTGEQAADAAAMESALVHRLRRQIRWLCRQIMTNALHRKQSDFCPPLDMPTGPDGRCQRSCIACWEQASLKAVEEREDAGTEEVH